MAKKVLHRRLKLKLESPAEASKASGSERRLNETGLIRAWPHLTAYRCKPKLWS